MRLQLSRLKPGQADLVLLPEYANAPGFEIREELRAFALRQGAAFLAHAAAEAERLQALVTLSAAVQEGAGWYNRTLVWGTCSDSQGPMWYDKVHLTASEEEELGFTAGAQIPVFSHRGLKIGFATCFDLYFSEHFEALAARGAKLVLSPGYQRSETADRIDLTARARALDGGVYLLRSSYAQPDPARGGHSLAASPEGRVIADAGSAAGLLTLTIDPERPFIKPASHGKAPIEHRKLLESRRRPGCYRPAPERSHRVTEVPFPRICAHRGLSQACPENSLPAFAAAAACGAHEIELDVWPSRDGVPVICHDGTVDRTTDGSGSITQMDWGDLRRLEAGAAHGECWRGVRLPRLEEVLELTDRRVGLNLHIQYADAEPEHLKRVIRLVRTYGVVESAYLALGSETTLELARKWAPDISLACLVRQDDPDISIEVARRLGCRRIQFFRGVTAAQIGQARQAGLICNLFYSDDLAEAAAYVDMGIDVVLTNRANILLGREGPFRPRQYFPAGPSG
jgi:glycerophosphoryl diester phosphodiesterase/predicted amidohydrolase